VRCARRPPLASAKVMSCRLTASLFLWSPVVMYTTKYMPHLCDAHSHGTGDALTSALVCRHCDEWSEA
jgi:hypothetical protein